ncbi:hypothetical protein GCT19_16085 [Paraburkholderia sp. CNPSo 3155]|nr:hypothetical protein [Paraburkholderia atlantica]NUY34169.1 hypothetical protein [Paraburkholderia atlantica]
MGKIDTDQRRSQRGSPDWRHPVPVRRRNRRAKPLARDRARKTDRLPQTRLLRRIAAISCDSVRRVRYLFIIKAILKDSKVVVCWIVKAFARTSASSS